MKTSGVFRRRPGGRFAAVKVRVLVKKRKRQGTSRFAAVRVNVRVQVKKSERQGSGEIL